MATGNPFTSGQASPAMNFIAPDIATQQQQLARQQQMADLLRSQAIAPSGDTQMVGGWAVPKSPFEGLAKVLQGAGTSYMQNKIDSKQMELSKALQERMGGMFDSMFGGGSPAPQTSAFQTAQTLGDATGNSGPPDPSVVQAVQQVQPQQSDQVSRIRNAAKAAMLMGNTDLANKLVGNLLELTTNQKDMAAMGQDPLLMGKLGIAEARKKGIVELQPGTTALDLATGQERFQPKVGEGISLNNGVASQIPGYADANAGIEGAKAGAVAGATKRAELPYLPPTKVDLAGGPKLMTPAQQIQLANGGFPSGTPIPSPTPTFGSDQRSILERELANEKDPANRAALQREIARLPAQAPGVALQDDGAASFSKEVSAKGAQSLLDSRDKARAANDELSSIYESRNAIKSGAFQGFGADAKTDAIKIAQGFGIPIDSAKSANTDYLRSTLGKGMLDNAKKLGVNPTDADARRLDVIIGTIGKDPQAMSKLLDWREQQAGKVIDQHNRDIESASQGGAKFPFDLRVTRNQDRNAAPAPAAAKTFNTLPNPAEYSGKRMRAPDGSIIRSNGKAWIKE